jgi:N6-L-threonylcarbamoyladenine synthase
MLVLGIETSCDETSAALVRDGGEVLSCVISSQVKDHAPYGGVVPELASRRHVENIPYVLNRVMEEGSTSWDEVDALAVTCGPGLAPSLLVGVSAAKGLSQRLNKPLYYINHLEAHLYSVLIGKSAPAAGDICPFLCLLVSGGHTCLVDVKGLGHYTVLCETVDDAAGEAFDKGATLLGLGYPGGPIIDKLAKSGRVDAHTFPRSRAGFSFSGLKTSLKYFIEKNPLSGNEQELADICASYQEAIVDALITRTFEYMEGYQHVACVGGVSLNSRLRGRLAQVSEEHGVSLHLAEPLYCMDNAAMIAGLATAEQGFKGDAFSTLDICPNLAIGEDIAGLLV